MNYDCDNDYFSINIRNELKRCWALVIIFYFECILDFPLITIPRLMLPNKTLVNLNTCVQYCVCVCV